MTKQNKNNNNNNKINIVDILDKDELTPTTQGYKTSCYSCGMQGGRTEGFIIFPESNTAYCHSSGKWFKLLEAYALKKGIIKCLDGRDTGETDKKVLGGELFTLTLQEFKNEFGTEMYNKLANDLNIKKSIEIPGNNRLMSDFADDLGDVYKSRNILFFRGALREVVEIHRYKNIDQDGKEYIENGFKEVEGNRFVTLAEMFISPWTTNFTKGGKCVIVKRSMTQNTANIVLKSANFQNKLPIITRIFDIQIPIIYDKRLTFPKKGYDKRFGSWLPYNAPQIKTDMLTLEEAKELIDKIFEEFCFASEKDKINAIAAFITPFMRGLFPKFSTRTPVFIYMANRERAGKDYCAGCTGILYEGVNIEEPAISNDEKGASNNNEEIRKKIMACMMQGKKRFHSANNKGLINNSVLEGVTTAEIWSDRVLGRSENVTFNNEMDYSLSANIGTTLTPDLANRARIINLHLADEDANARKFKNPRLHEWIYDNREIIISALYKFVENWVEKGMIVGSVPFTSFPHWASVCGGIMEAAGYNNPCKVDNNNNLSVSLDSDTEEMKLLFEAVYANSPNESLTKDEIRAIVENEGILTNIDFNNKSDQTKFAMRIDRYVNRILSNIIMKVDSLERRASRRRYSFEKIVENEVENGFNENGDIFSQNGSKIDDFRKNDDDKNVEKLKKDCLNDCLNDNNEVNKSCFDGLMTSGNLGNLGNLKEMEEKRLGNLGNLGNLVEGRKEEKIGVYQSIPEYTDEKKSLKNGLQIQSLQKNSDADEKFDFSKKALVENMGFSKNDKNVEKRPVLDEKGIFNDKTSFKPMPKGGNLGNFGNVCTPVLSGAFSLEIERGWKGYQRLPGYHPPKNLGDFEKMYQNYKNKEENKKEKTDRELQFWEAPECAEIVEKCTKKQVFDWIEQNYDQNGHTEEQLFKMYESLGDGCWKFVGELIQEGLIKVNEKGHWEVCKNGV